MKILAVDDEPIFLELLLATLHQLGFEDVTEATSGDEALTIMQSENVLFDCFLLDIKMPEMNGIELCRSIRCLPEYRWTPIVMNTVLSEKGSIDDAFAAGASDYLTKPINRTEIKTRLGMVRKLVQERKRADADAAVYHEVLTETYVRGFSHPFDLSNVTGAIEYLAMQNYLLTLGKLRSFTVAATGIQIINGQALFELSGPGRFSKALSDVGSCIADCIKGYDYKLSYAGNGSFVFLTPRLRSPNSGLLSAELNEILSESCSIHDGPNFGIPKVTVGSQVIGKPLSLGPATDILSRATDSARAVAEQYADRP